MTVGELIDLLQQVDRNRLVVMSRDAEGNGYSPLAGAWSGSYSPNWSGEAGLETLTPEDLEQGYTTLDIVSGQPALILCPVN
jgi:hypothetical protein